MTRLVLNKNNSVINGFYHTNKIGMIVVSEKDRLRFCIGKINNRIKSDIMSIIEHDLEDKIDIILELNELKILKSQIDEIINLFDTNDKIF